jgi:hypothetical protein
MNSYLKIVVMVAAMALLIPTGAIAKRPEDKPAKAEKAEKAEKPSKFETPDTTIETSDDTTIETPDVTDETPAKAKKTPKVKLSTANVKGVVTANDGTTLTLTVDKASGHAKACNGLELTFDVSEARFHTADNDADADMDAADVLVGHAVKVRGKVARTKGRKTTCALEGQALPARAVHNRTTPPVEDDAEETDGEETEIEEPVIDEPVVGEETEEV